MWFVSATCCLACIFQWLLLTEIGLRCIYNPIKILKNSAYPSFWPHKQAFFWWVKKKLMSLILNGPGHVKTCLMPYATNKGVDQPAHPRSLISTFVVHSLDSMIGILAIYTVWGLKLASVAEQAGSNLTWSKILKDRFSHVASHSVYRFFRSFTPMLKGCFWPWHWP